jgi:hypothetical protein
MNILKSLAVFLLGAGFAAGAYVSGIAQRVPGYFEGLGHMHFAPSAELSAGPVVVRVSSLPPSGGTPGCAPAYKLENETNAPIYFTTSTIGDPGESDERQAESAIKVPPGSTMVPSRTADYRTIGDRVDAGCQGWVEEIEFGER